MHIIRRLNRLPMIRSAVRATTLAGLVLSLAACNDSSFVISGSTQTPAFGTLPAAATLYDLTAMGRAMVIYGPPLDSSLEQDDFSQTFYVSNILDDVNGDGVDDLLLGARALNRRNGLFTAGEVFLFFGPANWETWLDLENETATRPNVRVIGASEFSGLFVYPRLGAGDFDSDGITDVYLSSPLYLPPSSTAFPIGRGYIFLGETLPDLPMDIAATRADITLQDGRRTNRAPFDLHGTIDFNGDSKLDIIVQSRLAHGFFDHIGIIFGTAQTGALIDFSQAAPDISLVFETSPHLPQLLFAEDLNADGLDDLVVTVREMESSTPDRALVSAILVFLGSPSLSGELNAFDAADTVVYLSDSRTGRQILGDINADGIADLIYEDNRGIHAIFGSTIWPEALNMAIEAPDLSIFGSFPNSRLYVGGIIDMNGDGIDDLIAVDSGDRPTVMRENANSVHLVLGGTALAGLIDLTQNPAALAIYGADPEDNLSTAGFAPNQKQTGDFNGDGIADLVLSARGAGIDNDSVRVGELYVFYGSETITTAAHQIVDLADSAADATIYGSSMQDLFGRDTVSFGDLNHDGIDDLVIAVPNGDGPDEMRTDAGEVYIIFGGADME